VPRIVRRSATGSVEVEELQAVQKFVEDVPDLTTKPSWPQRLVAWNQRLWWLILPGVVVLMVWGWFIYDEKVDKGGFFRMPDQETLVLFMRGADGTDVRVTSETMLKFEQLLLPIHDGAEMNATVYGNQAYMAVEFDDNLLHSGIPMLYRERLVELADLTGGTTIYIAGFSDTPYLKGNFRGSVMNSLIKITGYNSRRLTAIAEETLAKVQRQRRVRNARITGSEMFGRATTEETVITLRRGILADYGLSVIEVVTHLQRLLGVDTPWNMLIEGEQERVQLSFMDADSIEFSQVAEQVIENMEGARVRLGDLLTMETVPLSDAVVRENQRYTQLVNWEYVGTDRMRQAYLKKVLDSIDLPYGYTAEESRQEFLTEEEESDLLLTVILAAVFILMVMAALFESFTLPILVLTSLPMALFGVVFIFWKSTTTFDSSAQIGLVLLFGVVVNNAILLVSRFRSEATLVLRARLHSDPESDAALLKGERTQVGGGDLWFLQREERTELLRRAIARGTLVRLRSILLTSGTTIVGLVPLLIQFEWVPMKLTWFFNVSLPFTLRWMDADNQDIWQNLALTSIGGLFSSTILILLAMPPLYYFSIRFGWLCRTIWTWIRKPRHRSEPPTSEPTLVTD